MFGRIFCAGVTEARNVVVAVEIGASGVPVTVTLRFWDDGAFAAAEIVMVAALPGRIGFGDTVAVVPTGRPLTAKATSKVAVPFVPVST